MIEIEQAMLAQDLEEVRSLFDEYSAWLNIDWCAEHLAAEAASLPGVYGPPGGGLLLARHEGAAAGCVAMRKLTPEICEMKRLYVRPAFRGKSVGRALASELISYARHLGYKAMRLDTVEGRMQEAVSLYKSLGFQPIEPYNHHPVECTAWMELKLRA